MQASVTTTVPDPTALAEATAVYTAAFADPPYTEGPDGGTEFRDRVVRYGRERDGFRFATVRADDGALQALALAVLARPGDWWRDRAAAALGEADAARWLGPLCLEVVHLAVTPAAQGNGLGRLVHDVLVSGTHAPTGILSCHPEAVPAQRLYLTRGWTPLTTDFRTGDRRPYWLLARPL
jgi:GNAT superfamily N-acetyltransferase